jgi:hypothetical protein
MMLRIKKSDLPAAQRWVELFVFSFIALVHVPLIVVAARGGANIRSSDSIGFFDLFLILCFALLFFTRKKYHIPGYVSDLLNLYLGFLAYITVGFLVSSITHEIELFSAALVVKQYQYLLVVLVGYYLLKRSPQQKFHWIAYMILAVIFINGIYKVFINHTWYRLGLVMKEGVSSNPAGFIISSCLIVLLYVFDDKEYFKSINKTFFWGAVLVGLVSLALTLSRTNTIALLFIILLYTLARMKLKVIPLVFTVLSAGIIVFFIFGTQFLEWAEETRTLSLIVNPSQVLEESSFIQRYTRSWFIGFDEWKESWFSMLFGIGFGQVRLTDSLYFTMLYSTGFVGLFLYLMMFIKMYKHGGLILRLMVVFVLINSINAETTLNSYRSMQIFLILLLYLLMHEYKKKRI